MLIPMGYSMKKSLFYKEVDGSICFFIHARRVIHSRISTTMEVYVDAVPYCADLEAADYDPLESAIRLIDILKMLDSETISVNNAHSFYTTRLMMDTEETMISSINNICCDMERKVLPYIHKFVDLDYYYNEIKNASINGKSYTNSNSDFFLYGLSLKLHKYDDVLPYIEKQLAWHNNIIQHYKSELEEHNKGNVNQFLQKKMKKDKTFLERFINAERKMIVDSESEVTKFTALILAIQTDDHDCINEIVKKTEKRSREYINQMLT